MKKSHWLSMQEEENEDLRGGYYIQLKRKWLFPSIISCLKYDLFFIWKLYDIVMMKLLKLYLTIYYTNIDWLYFQILTTDLEGEILCFDKTCMF